MLALAFALYGVLDGGDFLALGLAKSPGKSRVWRPPHGLRIRKLQHHERRNKSKEQLQKLLPNPSALPSCSVVHYMRRSAD